jgi:hypothetical protein
VALKAADLATAPSGDLLKVYARLQELQASDQGAVAENVVWKRDAATFTLKDGRLVFAAPVEGRVLAAAFTGQAIFELDPPTAIDRHQIERFTKGERLSDHFKEAVFFFTDSSFDELQKLVNIRPGADNQAGGKLLAAAQKKYREQFNGWWENFIKGHPAMRNLAARMLADLTDPTNRGFFLADLKTEHHDELLFHISWNRDTLLLPFFATDEEVMLVHYKHEQYYEWWSGFHLAEEYARSSHPEHRTLLIHCRQEHIEAEISKDNHLSAVSTMEFEVPGGAPRILPLSLTGVLRISSVLGEGGNKLAFIQEDRKLESDPWVILPEPANPGRSYSIKIAYAEDSTRESRIVHQEGTGLYFVVERESWFPSFGAFDDRAQYSLHFRSPKKFKFVATGRKLNAEMAKEFVESSWESEIPYTVIGFNYGDSLTKATRRKILRSPRSPDGRFPMNSLPLGVPGLWARSKPLPWPNTLPRRATKLLDFMSSISARCRSRPYQSLSSQRRPSGRVGRPSFTYPIPHSSTLLSDTGSDSIGRQSHASSSIS